MSLGEWEFREGPVEGVVFRKLEQYGDARGWLIELFRRDELDEAHHPAMGYVSQTLPGMARGPHEHRDQSDLFAFVGPGDFKLYVWDTRVGSATAGNRQTLVLGESNLQAVLIPPGVVHAYRNVSRTASLVVNFPNRLYRGDGRNGPADEIRHEDRPDSPFVMD
jgi:dTDP-4-dehydrorhamnose 3,5-epimerase